MQIPVPFQLRMNQDLTDLNPVIAGECLTVSHSADPKPVSTFENYMIHYIRCGRGRLVHKGQTMPLRSGQIFILPPGATAVFHPDADSQWALRWVGFNGVLAHRFSELPVVMDAPAGTFLNLCDLNGTDYMLAHKLASELLFLYSALLKPQKRRILTDTVEWIQDYVKKNYMHHITVTGIAAELGLDPDYLTRKFKKKTNLNIQSYILLTRITNARRYLVQGYSVKETASLCGFSDASGFCQAFKKLDTDNRSPTQWQRYIIGFHQKRTDTPQKPLDFSDLV